MEYYAKMYATKSHNAYRLITKKRIVDNKDKMQYYVEHES